MAHADYDCCAVCDCKLSYQGYCSAGTKDEICSRCVANLAECGIIVHNVDELVTWINESPDIIVKAVLVLVGFRKCYYQNRVDDAVVSRGIGFATDSNPFLDRYILVEDAVECQ